MNMLQCIVDSLSFLRFYLQDVQFSLYVWNRSAQSDAGLKVSLAIIHMTTFILPSSNLEWQEKESIICGGVYFQHRWNLSVSLTHTHTHTHTHPHIFLAFLETGNKTGNLIVLHQFWKRTCQPTLLPGASKDGLVRYSRWKITIIQFWMFFSIRRPTQTPEEELKRFKFANVTHY